VDQCRLAWESDGQMMMVVSFDCLVDGRRAVAILIDYFKFVYLELLADLLSI
jgi:hypothetical protein